MKLYCRWYHPHVSCLCVLVTVVRKTLLSYCVLPVCALVLSQTFRLLHEEGFFVGASSGLNVAAAVQVYSAQKHLHTLLPVQTVCLIVTCAEHSSICMLWCMHIGISCIIC